jgi:ABC-type antimicrobial peptide transport system permease subunit
MNKIKIIFRHLNRQKLNTVLHITGLTLGISVCLLIALLIKYELSFDSYHDKADRTYRVITKWTEPNKQTSYHFSTPFPLANTIRTEMTGIENVTFAHPVYTKIVEVNPHKRFLNDRVMAVESDFPELFNMEVISGNIHQTLQSPYQAILTESEAKRMFGTEDPLGQVISFVIRERFEFTVGAVVKDFPPNTHLPASILVSHSYQEKFLQPNLDGWSYVSGTETLIMVPEDTDLARVETQLKGLADKHINSKDLPFRSDFVLQPLNDIHFNDTYANGGHWVPSVSRQWLWFFGIIGGAVLLLACINFINLSTAQSLNRAKEVGVRKSVGAGRINLLSQFLYEAWMLTFVAGILATALAQIVLPFMNLLLEKQIAFNLLDSPELLLIVLVIVSVTGLLAGIYPAWVITRFNPALTLKSGSVVTVDQGSVWLRKALVVTQFVISGCLLMMVLVMAQQVNYLRSKNLGFTKDNIITVDIQPRINKHLSFKTELEKIGQVRDVSFSTSTPSSMGHWGTMMNKVGRQDPTRKEVTLIFGDDRYCAMYDLPLVAGRFHEPADTLSNARSLPHEKQLMKAVVNEKLIKELEFASNEDAIGEQIWIGFNSGRVEIIGVVADFNSGPLQEAIRPVLITPNPYDYEIGGIQIEANSNIPETLVAIENAWRKSYPEGIFSYNFLDQQIDAYYKAEERLFALFKVFSGMAMFISCLGLWGLALFASQSRRKEIGIRKVLGASVNRIIFLLSKEFLILVAIALAFATPLAWYGMRQWLQSYEYKIELSGWIFILAGLSAVFIALITVSFQAMKSANTNPVDSLRSE